MRERRFSPTTSMATTGCPRDRRDVSAGSDPTNEPDRHRLLDCLLSSDVRLISAASLLEAAVVVDRRGDPVLSRQFDTLVLALSLQVAPVTEDQVVIGRAAYRDFGKGSGHPARLNFGDCFAYALARDRDEALLFVGDDFTQTDVVAER